MTVTDLEAIVSRVLFHLLHEEFGDLRETGRGKVVSAPSIPLKRAMQLKTAAALYDIPLDTLRRLCTRGTVKAQLVGGKYYISPAEMDRVFLGRQSPLKCEPKPEANRVFKAKVRR